MRLSKILLSLGVMLACCVQAMPQGNASDLTSSKGSTNVAPAVRAKPDGPIATVAGQPIYEQDLVPALGTKLLQLRNQEYQMKTRALDDVIREKLLAAEAKKRGLSPDKLLEQEVDSKVGEPSDAEVKAYYLAVKTQLNQPFDEAKPQIVKSLKQLKIQEARQEYKDSLRAKNQVVVFLKPPRVQVGYDPTRVRGNPEAPVTIVEFSDFQCPFCRQVEATVKDLVTKYNGQVKFAYRDFPLSSVHPQAETAAEASRCAQEQGKYWELHDAMFDDPSRLDELGLIQRAGKLGLDEQSFRSCLTSGKYKAQIQQDVQAGTAVGVNATPSFFINGAFLSGSQPEAEFEKVINTELASLGRPHPAGPAHP